jgi:hypothetical protein
MCSAFSRSARKKEKPMDKQFDELSKSGADGVSRRAVL